VEVSVFKPNNVTLNKWFDSSSVKMQLAVPTESNPNLFRCWMAMRRIAGAGLDRHASDGQAGG
jgi:hypothetical protein